MSTDDYPHGTWRAAFVGIFLGLYPVQQLLLQEPPQLALSLTEGMRGDIPETCPRNEGAGGHLENLCRRFSLSPEDRDASRDAIAHHRDFAGRRTELLPSRRAAAHRPVHGQQTN